jgi:hypothetical protein
MLRTVSAVMPSREAEALTPESAEAVVVTAARVVRLS